MRTMSDAEDYEVLTISETADFLKVSETTVRRHLHEIPHIRIGKQIRIVKNKLIEWMQDQMVI